MANSKKTFTRTVTVERFIESTIAAGRVLILCEGCQRNTEMLTFDEAVSFSGRRARKLMRLIENDAIHTSETTAGRLLICRDSLESFIEGEKQ